jgi:hypothetical protein
MMMSFGFLISASGCRQASDVSTTFIALSVQYLVLMGVTGQWTWWQRLKTTNYMAGMVISSRRIFFGSGTTTDTGIT